MFDKFEKYITGVGEKTTRHTFHKVTQDELNEVKEKIFIPHELLLFYENIGYGFFFDTPDSYSIDRLYSPSEFCKINLREDYYTDDPTLDYYDHKKFENYKIFFEVVEGNYLLIADNEDKGKNAIIYINEKIADSLEEFLNRFDDEGHYITALYDFSYSDYYVFPEQLESEEELEIYLQEFVKCVRYHENVIFPYLSDITNMAKYVGSVPFERSLEINVGGGYPVSFFKKLAILKWGGYEERYEEYKKGLEAFIEEGFSDPEEAVEAPLNKEGFVNLINYLENKPNPFLKS